MPKFDANASGTLTNRSGASRKLLARTSLTTTPPILEGEGIEDSFPSAASPATNADDSSSAAPSHTDGTTPASLFTPEPAAAVQASPDRVWSEIDEIAFQAMTARRKAAGFKKRGKDVSGHIIAIGSITPNAGTVASVVVSLVEGRGKVSRADLIDAMRSAEFANPKARRTDRGWCQGYVAGCIRDGFLRVTVPASVATVPTGEPADDGQDTGQ